MKILYTKRSDDWMAYIEGDKKIWACGKTILEAIGNLILTHQKEFKILVEREYTVDYGFKLLN